ncbi:hypothetical protein [Sphingomonas sp.]|uniref:hypothetical protein n=1 Tax=Sphingomonas sp. TaxID=28214 RepID=UPI003CC63F40
MLYGVPKAAISDVVAALALGLARRYPGSGALIASQPVFLLIPALLRHGAHFWAAPAPGCLLTIAFYGAIVRAAPLGIAM